MISTTLWLTWIDKNFFCVLNCTSDLAEVWEWNGGIFY
jgi:hypothetical protein